MTPILQGLTQKHWKQYEDILIISNKEQKFEIFKKLVKSMNGNSKETIERLYAECKLAGVE